MKSNEFHPVRKWHTNSTIQGRPGVLPLPATVSDGMVCSVWKLHSIYQRLRFLANGEITLVVLGKQPPVALEAGDTIRKEI